MLQYARRGQMSTTCEMASNDQFKQSVLSLLRTLTYTAE